MPNEPTTQFLNVDLDLVSTIDLEPLVQHLAPHTMALRDSLDEGRRTVWLELMHEPQDLEDAIVRFAALVESLPSELRALWDQCESRNFNVGIQSGLMPYSSAFLASAHAIAKLAAIGAQIEVTVYGAASKRA